MTMEEEVKQISSFIRIFSSYLNSLEKKMANEMLTFNEIRVMLELHDNEQLSTKDIEQRLDFDKSYMSRILKTYLKWDISQKINQVRISDYFIFLLLKRERAIAIVIRTILRHFRRRDRRFIRKLKKISY